MRGGQPPPGLSIRAPPRSLNINDPDWDEEVYEVPLEYFGRPEPGNRKKPGNNSLAIFEKGYKPPTKNVRLPTETARHRSKSRSRLIPKTRSASRRRFNVRQPQNTRTVSKRSRTRSMSRNRGNGL